MESLLLWCLIRYELPQNVRHTHIWTCMCAQTFFSCTHTLSSSGFLSQGNQELKPTLPLWEIKIGQGCTGSEMRLLWRHAAEHQPNPTCIYSPRFPGQWQEALPFRQKQTHLEEKTSALKIKCCPGENVPLLGAFSLWAVGFSECENRDFVCVHVVLKLAAQNGLISLITRHTQVTSQS